MQISEHVQYELSNLASYQLLALPFGIFFSSQGGHGPCVGSSSILPLYEIKSFLYHTFLTLFPSSGCHFGISLPFSLYLRHGFRSESEQSDGNRVKRSFFENSPNFHFLDAIASLDWGYESE